MFVTSKLQCSHFELNKDLDFMEYRGTLPPPASPLYAPSLTLLNIKSEIKNNKISSPSETIRRNRGKQSLLNPIP